MRQIKIKHSHILMSFALLACIIPLYWAKSEADKMRDHMQTLQSEVQAARKNVKTLEAEVAFLSRYDRIETVAIEQLGMVPLSGAQIADISDIEKIAPIIKPQVEPPMTLTNAAMPNGTNPNVDKPNGAKP